jgi:DNA helicase HerA-like ATPase
VSVPRTWRDLAREYLAQHLEAAPPTLTLDTLVDRVLDPSVLPNPPLLSKRAQREALAEQLRLLTEGTQRFLFQRGRRLDIGDLVRPTAPGKVPLNVIWLNALADTEAKQRYVAMVLSDVYAWMLRNPSQTPQLLLYFDEVSPYMPPSREPPSKKVLLRIFREGRKYGLCGLFCTQNFTDVDYKILAQANTRFMGKIGSPQDKERARKMLPVVRGFDPAHAAERLVNATSGVFLASGGPFPTPRWLKGRPLLVHHEAPWGEEEIAAHTPEGLRAHFQ